MRADEFIANMKLELHEESDVPNRDGYAFHGNGHTKRRLPKWQKAFDVVDEFIASNMEIASVDTSIVTDDIPFSTYLKTKLAHNICTYARMQDIVAKKRGDKIYLIKEN